MIPYWSKNIQDKEPPNPVSDEDYELKSLMEKLRSESVSDHKDAAERIKFLACSSSSFRDLLVRSAPSGFSKLFGPLAKIELIPNVLLRDIIQCWCKNMQEKQPPNQVSDDDQLMSLMEKLMSESVSDQKKAAERIKFLAYTNSLFRDLLVESVPSIFTNLLGLLGKEDASLHPDLQENLLMIILNIMVIIDDKKIIPTLPDGSITLLVKYLETGTETTRSHAARSSAAMILFSLAQQDYNRFIIGSRRTGAIDKLTDLIKEGNPVTMYEAAETLYELCRNENNKIEAIKYGAVSVLWEKIMADGEFRHELILRCLVLLSNNWQAANILHKKNITPSLLELAKESTNERTREYCLSIILAICDEYSSTYKQLEAGEQQNNTISDIGNKGGLRATAKANEMLRRLKSSFK